MAKTNSTSTATPADETEKITASDIECAWCDLESNGEALEAIANAVQVLSALEPKPKELYSHTITRLMAHSVYLASSLTDGMGSFIEQVEKTVPKRM